MLKMYLRTAFRHLLANKTFSLLNIFGLAIGLCCAGLIFLWVEDELLYDQFNVKKERLYRVNINATFDGNMYTMGSTPRPLAAAMIAEIPGVANAGRMSDESQQILFAAGEKSLYMNGRYADPALLSMFTFIFKEGSAKNALTQPRTMLLTESAAEKLFGGSAQAVGRVVRIDNDKNFTITAVVQDLPGNSTLQFEWLAPYMEKLDKENAVDWGSFGPYTFVELSENAHLTSVNKSLQTLLLRNTDNKKREAFLWPMANWRLYGEFKNGQPTGGGRISELRLLSGIAWIILLIACINFMNLATANSQKRCKQVGVQKTLGAGRTRLALQFLGEAIMIALLAVALAVLLIQLTLPLFNLFMQKKLVADIFHPRHITALLALALVCGLVAGSYPALYMSSFKPVLVLKGLKIRSGGAVFIRKGLVVLQFTISVIFICSTIVVYQQIQHVKNRELGLDKDNLVEINLRQGGTKKFAAIQQDLLNTGLIENVALTDRATLNGGNTDDRFRWQGKPEGRQIAIAYRNVTPAFVRTSGMTMIAGRDFTTGPAVEKNNVIISESFAKLMGNESAVGKIIQSPRGNEEGVFTNLTVVGVVKDYVYGNMFGNSPGPVLLFCQPTEHADLLYARIRPAARVDQALTQLETILKRYNPGYPVTYKFVDEQFNEKFKNEMLTGQMSGVFSILAIIISCLGLFGLAAYTSAQRTKEISIRKVLGASVAGIAQLLSKDFLRWVIIACCIAFPLSWWMMYDWLQQYQYRISIQWWVFLLAGGMAMFVALATVSFQAVKAAMANPVSSLKEQ